jgi:hypothetical protein
VLLLLWLRQKIGEIGYPHHVIVTLSKKSSFFVEKLYFVGKFYVLPTWKNQQDFLGTKIHCWKII